MELTESWKIPLDKWNGNWFIAYETEFDVSFFLGKGQEKG